jgi:hypothetical protein
MVSKAFEYADKVRSLKTLVKNVPKVDLQEGNSLLRFIVDEDGRLMCGAMSWSVSEALKLRDWLTETFEKIQVSDEQ